MKRTILKSTLVAAAVAVTALTGWRAYEKYDMRSNLENAILAANIEALTDGNESGEGGSADSWTCWSEVDDGKGVWICGSPCWWDNYKKGISGMGICRRR